ncbi:hypothetical protein D9V32_03355 [Mycetocola tolaasinivorans]|uniref:PDGLE domain-containing protein n=1 Tax=Mycetocola tolaasinivorans TaxID=76635 RepID=A0A3L7AB94_9MICO|nr:hypothetical protein [Mycetocola tolaasinivorans]RLP77497.1 hypothetical protein D9V32_03355 [Mycetocola tolaasinivorans]
MSTPTTDSRSRRATLGFLLCLVGPLVVGVILNALVRPGLARSLGGEQHVVGGAVRSRDVWWTFTPEIERQHPVLTTFLGYSDGLIAMCVLASIVVIFLVRWVVRRRKR